MKPQLLTGELAHAWLKPRDPACHKGACGHVLVIGGAPGYAGAVRLAGEAALRTGAGLVSIATHPAHAPCVTVGCSELMCHAVDEAASSLPALIERASVVVIGPGLGQSAWSQACLAVALKAASQKPLILDADALNLLALQAYSAQPTTIYTPHPGEAARLLSTSVQTVQSDRLQALHALTQRDAGVYVLKCAGTLIGQRGKSPYLCTAGNPGMATAGMGDVLTGIIAGLVAQHIPPLEAACLGVWGQSTAADKASVSGKRDLVASSCSHICGR